MKRYILLFSEHIQMVEINKSMHAKEKIVRNASQKEKLVQQLNQR